ncbi:hypothetical protein [Cuspidothrix issatschenkoi]|uniref:hypothetical protein n=1 Tax=Cuspidothrix issatschenkoi TaxID=230752 RepID=UPI001A9C9823|nr:hypothetical protein [Cuspidothrix issatschenkoi]
MIQFKTKTNTLFCFWDWIFGTLYVPKQYEKLDLGLPSEEGKQFNSVLNFYWQPFKAVFHQRRNQ